jgi:hypothetical protein
VPKKTTPKKATASPERIAAQIACGQFEIDLSEIYASMLDHPRFNALVEALLDDNPDRVRQHILTLNQECELYDQIKDASPENLRSQLWLLNEWNNLEMSAHQEAGFLMGVEIGRRLGKTGAR